ncbi:HAD family hydrolase [Paenibacillus sp. CAU 1782]
MPQLVVKGRRYPVDAILFDKDGTLLQFMGTWGVWSRHLVASYTARLEEKLGKEVSLDGSRILGIIAGENGGPADYDRNGPLAMGTIDQLMAVLAWHGYQAGATWAQAMEAAYGGKQDADKMLEAERSALPLPGALSFVELCRSHGLKLAVVTADDTAAAEKHLEWLGIRDCFDACIGADRAERSKPFPDMALLACDILGVHPTRAAVIGDTGGDMAMAQSAGVALAIGIQDGFAAPPAPLELADVCVTGYKELDIEEDEA